MAISLQFRNKLEAHTSKPKPWKLYFRQCLRIRQMRW